MDPVIQGTPTTVVFGIDAVFTWGVGGASEGRTVRSDLDPTVKGIELLDGNGIPTGEILVPQMVKGTVEIEADSALAAPTIADACTLAGAAMYLIKPAKLMFERGGIARYSLELHAVPAAGVAGWPSP